MTDPLAGLPEGVLDLARQLWTRAGGGPEPVAGVADAGAGGSLDTMLVGLLRAPHELEADWPSPADPRAVGGGWVNAEVIEDDLPILQAMTAEWSALGPEGFAAAAQELRLPVVPYRRLSSTRPTGARPGAPAPPDEGEPPGRTIGPARVIDLSTHWAGPLATSLLADAGAHVLKVDPSCRPDGFRVRPELYRRLNGNKEIVDLDLRLTADRHRFEDLLTGADLLVESFSRRVMANLGYGPDRLAAIAPRLAVVSIKAFPFGSPEQDWLAYGPGVHAASGLGLVGDDPVPAAIAYPDPLAGLTAYGAAMRLLADPARRPRTTEISLAAVIEPLVAGAATGGRSRDGTAAGV